MAPTSYNDFKDMVERRIQDGSNAEFAAADEGGKLPEKKRPAIYKSKVER